MQKARRRPKASTACRHTVSGSFSLPYSGFFSPFPHGTSSLSVSEEYLALPDGSGGFRQDFTCPALLRIPLSFKLLFVYGIITLFDQDFQLVLLNIYSNIVVLQPLMCRNISGLGQFRFARHYSGNHFCFLLLRLLRCFSSARSPPLRILYLQYSRFPHSEMYGSIDICSSPYLIAAYHVFLRLSEPRHSPCALNNLLISL